MTDPLLRVEQVRKYFALTRGLLFMKTIGHVKAVDGVSFTLAAGETLGTVVAVPNYGGGDLLEIAPAQRGPTGLLPFTRAFVPVVEIAEKRIVVALPDDFFEPARARPDEEEA